MSYIGVDLHKKSFVACYREKEKEEAFREFPNMETGLEEFAKTLSCFDTIAVEATGLSRPFAKRFQSLVHSVKLVAPSKFHLISQSTKKTDKHDASALALGLEKGYLPFARLRSEAAEQLMTLVSGRRMLIQMRVRCMNQMGSLLMRRGINVERNKLLSKKQWEAIPTEAFGPGDLCLANALTHQFIELSKSVREIENNIETQASQVQGYDSLIALPGIGATTAACLLANIDEIDDFKSAKKLAAYLGIVPVIRSSGGKTAGWRITKAGRSLTRGLLIWAAWKAMYQNESLFDFYYRVRSRRGAGKARGAVARKFLILIFFVLKEDKIVTNFERLDFADLKNTLDLACTTSQMAPDQQKKKDE